MFSDKEDNVFGPVDLGSEKLGNAEKDGNASVSVLVWRVGRPVRGAQHQGLCAGGLWGPEDGIHIGPSEVPSLCQWVGQREALCVHLQTKLSKLCLNPREGCMAWILSPLLFQPRVVVLSSSLLVIVTSY